MWLLLSRTTHCCVSRRLVGNESLIRVQQCLLPVTIEASAVPQAPIGIFPCDSRLFSTSPPKRDKKAGGAAMMNEHLIKTLMRRYDASAGALHVRLVVDEGPGQASSIKVVSLLQAMETARDLDVDLIGVNLEQDPPVVKAQDYTKLAYKAVSKKQKASSKATKEFTFRAGIAKNDMDRKVLDIIRFLTKGHNCRLSIRASGFNMRQDPVGVTNLIQNLMEQVGDVGICEKGAQINEEGNRASFLLRPNSKRSES